MELKSQRSTNDQMRSELARAQSDLRDAEDAVARLQTLVDEQQQAMRDLADGRIPGLQPLAFDELIRVNDQYVFSMMFIESGVGTNRRVEYHATLKNGTEELIRPEATLYLFNSVGLQVGESQILGRQGVNARVLQPGETRTASAEIEIPPGETATAYRLVVR